MTANPKVLYIGSVWPEPDSSAAGMRALGLLGLLKRQGWEVTCASAAAESPHAADLGALGIAKDFIALNDASFDAYVAGKQPDFVVFDRFMTEEQFGWRVAEHGPNAVRVLDTIDLHLLRLARQKAFRENRPVSQEDLQSDTAKREIASILRCDLSLMVSEAEMECLRQSFRLEEDLLHLYPLAIAEWKQSPREDLPSWEQRKGFVTIGNFRHEPNWDSVLYLKQIVWPAIRKSLPEAVLQVYGSYLTPKAQALHAPKDGFFICGRADNAQAVMREARICLAPLRFGAGIKGKLLDAMRAGTPSVTTDIGAEGMRGEEPWGGFVGKEPEELASEAVNLYLNLEDWKHAQDKGWALFEKRFATDAYDGPLMERLTRLRVDLPAHRSRNFMGALLQHHTVQSTKYMAKWIEAKNKAGKPDGDPIR